MSAPLDFLDIFKARMREAGIGFALTSGMACVHYGLQQTTKDSDWIIPAEDLEKLRALFSRLEGLLPPWRISYRQICGAPLEKDFMQHGWTSHLSIWDTAGSVEHKVDIFSKPPRVRPEEMISDPAGWASQHVVAQMKKTDRDKDWPIVDGLGQRLWGARLELGLLHVTNYEFLVEAWRSVGEEARQELMKRRPLLKLLSREPLPTPGQFRLQLLLERLLWEEVNEQRHSRYKRPWKEFYRRWRKEPAWQWPTQEPFREQHARLDFAARRYGLPTDPLEGISRSDLVQAAVAEVLTMERFTPEDIATVLPSTDELLP